jgi:hypothetical protein
LHNASYLPVAAVSPAKHLIFILFNLGIRRPSS